MSNGTVSDPPAEGTPDASREWARQVLADPKARREAYARLTISGGLPGEGGDPLTVELSAEGGMRFALAAADTGPGQAVAREVDDDTLVELFGVMEGRAASLQFAGAAAEAAVEPADIPPDSVVGRLEVSIGDATRELVFMADEEQAKTAGFELPPAAARVVQKIVDLATAEEGGEGEA